MENYQVIADEVLDKAAMAIAKGEHWMAYNNSLYFIDKDDVLFFANKELANDFADNNISDLDHFHVIQIDSVGDLLRRFPYDDSIKDTNDFSISKHLKNILSPLKFDVMNTENVEALKKNLLNMGFGDSLNKELAAQVAEGKPEFQLKHSAEFNGDKVESSLNFKYSPTTEKYYFNSYDATLQKANADVSRSQTFYANYGNSTTLKEAYNLLDGRSVNKDLINQQEQPYNAWVKLDFENKTEKGNYEVLRYTEAYGFDLRGSLEKYPIKEMATPEKADRLLQSLEKGNVQSVTFEKEGRDVRMFVEASPKYKNVNVYDADMKLVINESQQQGKDAKQAASKEVGQGQEKEAKQGVAPAKDKNQKPVKTEKANSLLPKNRERTGKGLSV